MELKKALLHTGICKPEDLERLRINLQISEGLRNADAITSRYLITLDDRLLCSVKRLPSSGVYKVDDIVKTQQFFSGFSTFAAPVIYGIYNSVDSNVYIIEEPINSSMNLDEAVRCGEISANKASKIISQIFTEVAAQPVANRDLDLLTREIDEFITAAEFLAIPDDLVKKLKNILELNLDQLAGCVVSTTGDLIPRNILLSKGKPVVIDFDLSRKTHFFWIDIMRCRENSTLTLDINQFQFVPQGINPSLMELLFCLNEINLQRRVLTNAGFNRVIKPIENNTLKLFERIFSVNCSRMILNKKHASLNLAKVDGAYAGKLNNVNELQLFWADRDMFNEENSIKAPLLVDNVLHQYDFILPPGAIKHFRLDPGNHPAYVEIKSIILYQGDLGVSEGADPSIHWSKENDFTGLLPGPGIVCLEGQDFKRFLCINNDPQIFLESVSNESNEQPRFLRVAMSISNNIPENISREINQVNEILIIKERQLNQQVGELSRMQVELGERNEQLSLQDNELSRIQGQFNCLLNSQSWRFTAPLRWLGRIVKSFLIRISWLPKMIMFGNYELNYRPMDGIVDLDGEGHWKATNEDPQFLIEGLFPGGQVICHMDLTVPQQGVVQLFFDRGKGFSEQDNVTHILPRGGRHNFRLNLTLDSNIQRIRLDPINASGLIQIHTLYIYKPFARKILAAKRRLKSEIYQIFLTVKANIARKRLLSELKYSSHNIPIDIIIPIYNAFEDLVACVDSVLTNTTMPHRLILINDLSTDHRIEDFLGELEKRKLDNLLILRNEKNLGFVGTVNHGMLQGRGDVVLLNSDTEVPPGWLERLHSAINDDPTIGTITPISNNATICSFPNFCQDNILPEGYNVESLDAVFALWAPQTVIDLPTAVGFCMFITRQCLDVVGLFDEDTFGRGYCEENDFCMRAEVLGFRNVLCPNLFVYHKGSMSFGIQQKKLVQENLRKLEQKHPSYMAKVRAFIEADPILPIRQVVLSGLAVPENPNDGFGVLHILHSLGGGTERHVDDLIQVMDKDIRAYVLKGFPDRFEFIDRNSEQPLVYSFSTTEQAENSDWLRKLAVTFGIQLIHVHHVMGYPENYLESITKSGIPYLFTAHDYYAACPSYNLLDPGSKYCQSNTDLIICQDCLQGQSDKNISEVNVGDWRKQWSKFLEGADVVLAPSRATADILMLYYPQLKVISIEHGIDPFNKLGDEEKRLAITPSKRKFSLRVALLGAIGPHKGSRLLEELVDLSRRDDLPIQWIVIGYTDLRQEAYRSSDDRLVIHGPYEAGRIPELLNSYHVDLVFLPAIWPETYSYTLSEAWLAGYPVMATNLGALGQRICETGSGWTLPDLKANGIINVLLELIKHPEQIQRAKEKVKQLVLPDLNNMGTEYRELYRKYATNMEQTLDITPLTGEVLHYVVRREVSSLPQTNYFGARLTRKVLRFIRLTKLSVNIKRMGE